MARAGYRIFDADTHIIEPAEPIEQHLSAADRAKLAALGPVIGRAPAKAGMTRYRIGKMPEARPPARLARARRAARLRPRRTAARRGTCGGRGRRSRTIA